MNGSAVCRGLVDRSSMEEKSKDPVYSQNQYCKAMKDLLGISH